MTIHGTTPMLAPPPAGLLHGASLFLDFDGTLVAIAARPDAVAVEARLKTLLRRLHAFLTGRLAIVSGRAAADVGALLDDPALIIAGSHGAELRRPGAAVPPGGVALDDVTRDLLQDLVTEHPGVLVERKPMGLALHYRQAAAAQARCRMVAEQIAARTNLALQPGKMVIELRLAGRDKGTALDLLMHEAPLRDGRPIFIGDDETDEAGFRAASLCGGAGIMVGEPRPTAASFRLADVDGTLAWLDAETRRAAA